MTSPKRVEANRRNAARSTGPRSTTGKQKSRWNSLKHGLRARLPVLPGEDANAYQARLDGWTDSFQPRNAAELYLVERAVQVSWQLDRIDRIEVAHFAAAVDKEDVNQAMDVAQTGAALFHVSGGTIWLYPEPLPTDDADRPVVSTPLTADDPRHPARLVVKLESSSEGCQWMLDRWAELRAVLDDGRNWQPADRLRAIRLLGQQPLDAVEDDRVFSI
jgi:hypothetical protein